MMPFTVPHAGFPSHDFSAGDPFTSKVARDPSTQYMPACERMVGSHAVNVENRYATPGSYDFLYGTVFDGEPEAWRRSYPSEMMEGISIEKGAEKVCEPGYVMRNGRCVPDELEKPTCIPGYTLRNGRCEKTQDAALARLQSENATGKPVRPRYLPSV